MEWVFDTDVMARADRYDTIHDHWSTVMGLLSSIGDQRHFLVVDDQNRILGEYKRNLTRDGWVQRWVWLQVSRNRVMYRPGSLTANVSRGLRNLQFDTDDDVFVAVAARIIGGRLVAEESDYSAEVIDFLQDHGVRVMDCVTAKADIDNLTA